ncbi:MAG: hypothetical protein H7122_00855 [Chitinophagaceae bacterium]|nr:hypothetical protein [Chitinophagaceae bacterium]
MARTFIHKNTSFTDGRLTSLNSRIEFNSSEQNNTLDLAVFVTDQSFFVDGKIFAVVNEISDLSFDIKLELVKIISSTNAQAIYQGSLPLNEFKLKDNLIVLKTEISSSSVPMAIVSGFVEDINLSVTLGRAPFDSTPDIVFWNAITKTSLKFNTYKTFIDTVLCGPEFTNTTGKLLTSFDREAAKTRSPFIQSEEYNIIKFATEFYMLKYFGIPDGQLQGYLINGKLPYFDLVTQAFEDTVDTGDCAIRETHRLKNPFLVELIWSYWMEQAMLVQTLNAVSLRFQNLYHLPYIKPLERLDIDPLRPLSHILWGYIQDEQHRLSLKRRVYEYDHEYGLNLIGKAIPHFTPVESRVKFLEVFHDLLTSAVLFFREADDTTRIPDAFPVLNNLRETHLQLAYGNHNAYGNLTWTARHEMMVQQYILSRPEMREFLGGKPMIAYNEPWMDRVETMRSIQGWGDTSVVNYYELAVCGEQILLSIRLGNWNDINMTSDSAANWARAFRDKIQRYIHSYRVVTGVDLSEEVVDSRSKEKRYLQPSILIQKKIPGLSTIRRA